MAKTTDKIILGILIVLLIGLGSVFIAALGPNGSELDKKDYMQSQIEISMDEAKIIALDAVPGVLGEVEVEKENGVFVYEVEVFQGEVTKEVKISLQGKIIGVTEESEEELSSSDLEKIDGIITENQAREIALAEVGGRVLEIEAEREGGKVMYDVEVYDGKEIVEVVIDGQTGKILGIEQEDDDD